MFSFIEKQEYLPPFFHTFTLAQVSALERWKRCVSCFLTSAIPCQRNLSFPISFFIAVVPFSLRCAQIFYLSFPFLSNRHSLHPAQQPQAVSVVSPMKMFPASDERREHFFFSCIPYVHSAPMLYDTVCPLCAHQRLTRASIASLRSLSSIHRSIFSSSSPCRCSRCSPSFASA